MLTNTETVEPACRAFADMQWVEDKYFFFDIQLVSQVTTLCDLNMNGSSLKIEHTYVEHLKPNCIENSCTTLLHNKQHEDAKIDTQRILTVGIQLL